jgi:hypothetical protein
MNHDGCEKTVAKQPLRMLAAEILQFALNFSLLLSPLAKWYNGLFARTKVKETLYLLVKTPSKYVESFCGYKRPGGANICTNFVFCNILRR